MNELKAMRFFEAVPTNKEGFYQPGAFVDGYLKSEADKVIAQLRGDLKDLWDDKHYTDNLLDERNAEIAELKNYADEVNKYSELVDNQNERLLKIVRHNKYKRCLEIAAVCFEKSYSTTLVKYEKESGYRLNFYDWWGKRWLELAEKFKEAK